MMCACIKAGRMYSVRLLHHTHLLAKRWGLRFTAGGPLSSVVRNTSIEITIVYFSVYFFVMTMANYYYFFAICPLLAAVKCPNNSHYEICATACPATCSSLAPPQGCEDICEESCACDEDYILSGNLCIPFSQCGCVHNDRYYKIGEVFYQNGQCQLECKCTQDGEVMNDSKYSVPCKIIHIYFCNLLRTTNYIVCCQGKIKRNLESIICRTMFCCNCSCKYFSACIYQVYTSRDSNLSAFFFT